MPQQESCANCVEQAAASNSHLVMRWSFFINFVLLVRAAIVNGHRSQPIKRKELFL